MAQKFSISLDKDNYTNMVTEEAKKQKSVLKKKTLL